MDCGAGPLPHGSLQSITLQGYPHPAAHSISWLGGRVGERAGTAPRREAHEDV